jgi:hypothetical protein
MPINRADFDKGRVLTDLEKAIIEFLNANRDKAFTTSEISSALGFRGGQDFWKDFLAIATVNVALETLSKERTIVKRLVNGQPYYASK